MSSHVYILNGLSILCFLMTAFVAIWIPACYGRDESIDEATKPLLSPPQDNLLIPTNPTSHASLKVSHPTSCSLRDALGTLTVLPAALTRSNPVTIMALLLHFASDPFLHPEPSIYRHLSPSYQWHCNRYRSHLTTIHVLTPGMALRGRQPCVSTQSSHLGRKPLHPAHGSETVPRALVRGKRGFNRDRSVHHASFDYCEYHRYRRSRLFCRCTFLHYGTLRVYLGDGPS